MTVKSFFLRYGLLVILFLMILGICVLFQTLSIRQKVHVQLFVTGPHTAVAYLSKDALSNTQTFVFFQSTTSCIYFHIDSISQEPSQQCLNLTYSDSLLKQFRGNSFVTGYSYRERKSLWKIITEKML